VPAAPTRELGGRQESVTVATAGRAALAPRRVARYKRAGEGAGMTQTGADSKLRVFAVLFGILAVSNLLKPFRLFGDQTGFVLFGHRLTGTPNAIAGPAFGLYLLVYAAGIWRDRRYALPMAYAYAVYVVVNLVLFEIYGPKQPGIGFAIFGLVYATVAIGVSAGAAVLLARRRDAPTRT
jgi:hypothetical protein